MIHIRHPNFDILSMQTTLHVWAKILKKIRSNGYIFQGNDFNTGLIIYWVILQYLPKKGKYRGVQLICLCSRDPKKLAKALDPMTLFYASQYKGSAPQESVLGCLKGQWQKLQSLRQQAERSAPVGRRTVLGLTGITGGTDCSSVENNTHRQQPQDPSSSEKENSRDDTGDWTVSSPEKLTDVVYPAAFYVFPATILRCHFHPQNHVDSV